MSQGKREKLLIIFKIAVYQIDLLVVEIKNGSAVKCDGDAWHGMNRYKEDMARQRMFERCGLTHWRIRGSDFFCLGFLV
jgi:hypothetical protein